MNQHSEALHLINTLVSDARQPDFVWQVVAVSACLLWAFLIARWWRGRHAAGQGRFNEAGGRLAFPLIGMLLTGTAIIGLQHFMAVNLLKLTMPLLGSMALVRGVVFVLRQAFPRATWLTAWERLVAPQSHNAILRTRHWPPNWLPRV